MKKLFSAWLAISILVVSGNALGQTTHAAKDSSKNAKKAANAKLKADKAKAVTAKSPAPPVQSAPAPAPVVKPATTQPTKTVTQGVNKTADKAVGTDAKGRTIYQGPKGGRYTLTAAGNKEYIKKTN
jgi:hypothetical protein